MSARPDFRRILHATDFSKASAKATSRAVEMARREGAELLFAHVLVSVPPVGVETYVAPRIYDEMDAAIRKSARTRLEGLVRRARRAGARCEAVLLDGVVHEEIAKVARRRKSDLIVLGTHGRTGAARFLIGSVASRVAAVAPCPVMTVRGQSH